MLLYCGIGRATVSYSPMSQRLRTVLLVLAVMIGQSLSVAVASAHELDAGHTSNDCAICLTIQANDTPTPPAETTLVQPVWTVWAVCSIVRDILIAQPECSTRNARAPPF